MAKKERSAHDVIQVLSVVTDQLLSHGIKPEMTLKEYAAFTGRGLRQVQSDAERGLLPLMKKSNHDKRELRRVNVSAVYAKALLESLAQR